MKIKGKNGIVYNTGKPLEFKYELVPFPQGFGEPTPDNLPLFSPRHPRPTFWQWLKQFPWKRPKLSAEALEPIPVLVVGTEKIAGYDLPWRVVFPNKAQVFIKGEWYTI